MEGKIIVTVFPQDKQQKLRPALVLRVFPKYGDVLICGITSQLHQYTEGFDLMLDKQDPEFDKTGLKHTGICRLSMLTMLSVSDINGAIGEVGADTHMGLLKTLAEYLVKIK